MKRPKDSIVTSNLFTMLVDKHANGSKIQFAKLIGVKYVWLTQKCSGADGIPSEKLFKILRQLGYNNLNELDMTLDPVKKEKPKKVKPKKIKLKKPKKEPVKKQPKVRKPKQKQPPKRIQKRPAKRIKKDDSELIRIFIENYNPIPDKKETKK